MHRRLLLQAQMSLAQKTFSGIIWHFAQQLVRRGINFVVTLLLAKFLVPADFGLVAMMTVFLALGSSLMDSGFKQALIRKHDASQDDFNTVFYANLLLGLMSYAVLFGSAPWIALFYAEPRLVELIRVAAVGVLINAFLVVQSAQMHRELNFKAEMHTTIPAGILSGTSAVALAYYGFGVWALVIQMLLFASCNTVLLWFKQGWRPSLSFSHASMRQMYSFGYRLFLSGALDTIFKNIYVIVVSKVFSTSIAGYYFFAEKIKDMVINQLVSSIQTVTYPALVGLQDDVRLKEGYRKVIAVTTFVLFPVMTLMAALAQPIFELLLPEQWLPAAIYLQFLCVAGLLAPINSVNLNILKVKGRSDLYLKLEVFKKVLTVLVFALSLSYGIFGVLIGQIISSVLIYLSNSYFSAILINYSARQQIADFLASLLLSSFLGIMVFLGISSVDWSPLSEALVFGGGSASVYLLSAYLSKMRAFGLVAEVTKQRKNKIRK